MRDTQKKMSNSPSWLKPSPYITPSMKDKRKMYVCGGGGGGDGAITGVGQVEQGKQR